MIIDHCQHPPQPLLKTLFKSAEPYNQAPYPQHQPEHNLLFWKAFFAEALKVGRIIGPQFLPSTPKTE